MNASVMDIIERTDRLRELIRIKWELDAAVDAAYKHATPKQAHAIKQWRAMLRKEISEELVACTELEETT